MGTDFLPSRMSTVDTLRAERDAFQRDAYGLLQISKAAADALEKTEAERDALRRKLSAYQDAVAEVLLEHCDDEEIEAPELKRLIDERAAAEIGS